MKMKIAAACLLLLLFASVAGMENKDAPVRLQKVSSEINIAGTLKTIEECYRFGDCKIVLLRGADDANICNQYDPGSTDINAIVNAANEELDHVGGVARAICEAASTQESRENAKSNTTLSYQEYCTGLTSKPSEGSAICAESGELKKQGVSHIIHAVGPEGSNREHRERRLHGAYTISLYEAAQNKVKSIAAPPISIGIFGYNYEEATPVALKAITDFMRINPTTSIKEIRLLINTPKNPTMGEKIFNFYRQELEKYCAPDGYAYELGSITKAKIDAEQRKKSPPLPSKQHRLMPYVAGIVLLAAAAVVGVCHYCMKENSVAQDEEATA